MPYSSTAFVERTFNSSRTSDHHKHNCVFLERDKGEVLIELIRDDKLVSDDYGASPTFLEWMLKATLCVTRQLSETYKQR